MPVAGDPVPRVAIAGGGPAGMALALSLRLKGIEPEIFEARAREAVRHDQRVLALSDGSRQILDWLGAWADLPKTAIETIHVSQRGGFGRTVLRAGELGVPALGWVVAASDLIAALDAAVTAQGIVYRESQTIVVADSAGFPLTAFAEGRVEAGAGSARDYGQHAVLCNVEVAEPHRNVAWERFTGEGPLALLPLGERYSVVLTCADAVLDEVRALDDAAFLALLQKRFGTRHRFVSTTPRVAYPLGLRYRPHPVAERQVWLGNAAQTLHPVAGQGFNLALRDIWELTQALAGAADPGAPDVLAAYAAGRQADRRGAIGFPERSLFPPMEFLGFQLRNNLFVAPMAGVTDRPFRHVVQKVGRRALPCRRWSPRIPCSMAAPRRAAAPTMTARWIRSRCRSPAPIRR
jgi:2-octaprenyl-6-methoxyphenol hydroxylase